MLLWQRWGLGSLALCLMACGAVLVPVWVTDLGEAHYDNYLYIGDDGVSTFLVSLNDRENQVELLELDGDGQVSGEWETPMSYRYQYIERKLLSLGGDRAMLVSQRPEDLILLDPRGNRIETGLIGLVLAEDEHLQIARAYLSSQGTIVFNGSVLKGERGAEERIPAFGILDQQRNLLQFRLSPEFSRSSLFHDADNHRFISVVSTGEEDLLTTIRILDETLDIQSEQSLGFSFNPVALIHGLVLGNASIDGSSVDQAVSLDGSVTYPAILNYGARYYSVADGYFELDTGYNQGTVVEICFYNREFVQQWCREEAPANRRLYLRSTGLTENGDIVFTTDIEAKRVMGLGLSVAELTDALQAGLEVRGEVRRSVTHYVYSQQGKRVASFGEPDFFYRGRMHFCSIFDFCIAADDITPGVCSASTALNRNGNQMISAAGYCDDDSGNWDRRVSLWQW